MTEPVHVGQMVFSLAVEASGGGITRFVLDLVRNMDPDRIKLSVLALGDFGAQSEQDLVKTLQQQGIHTIIGAKWSLDNPYASFLKAMRTFRSELPDLQVNILNSHSEFTDIAALWLKMGKVVPKIARTLHNGHPLEWRKRPHRRWLLTNLLYPIYYDAEIGVSQPIVDRLNRRLVARKRGRQAECINNAINPARFMNVNVNSGAKKLEIGLPDDAAVIGTIGRLEYEKGYSDLLEAARLVVEHYPGAYFVIIGDGSLRAELEDQARAVGIAGRVIFTGPRSDIDQLLKCIDVFACSSLWEGLPTVILESMAAGVPVISSDIPGTRAIISHSHNGWLVPVKDPGAMAAGILSLLANPGLRAELASQALITVQNYTIDRVARSYEALYRRLYEWV